MRSLTYTYVIIERETNKCFQTLKTSNANFVVDNELHYSMQIDPSIVDFVLDKYYYNNQWVERVWSELNEFGEPTENATYTEVICAFN